MRYQKPTIISDVYFVKFIHICKKCETCAGLSYNAMLYVMSGIDELKAILIDPRVCECGTRYNVKQLFAPTIVTRKFNRAIAYNDYTKIFDRDKENERIHL